MNREQILSTIKGLAMSQGSYGRMYEFLTSGTGIVVLELN